MKITNEDNMVLMARYPDNYFDLAIVDPPYGIGIIKTGTIGGSNRGKVKNYGKKEWDNTPPNELYFKELNRVSKNQIIWGANYMTDFLPPSMGWVFWDKCTTGNFSDGELAYTSFDRALRRYKYTWSGFRQGPTNQVIETRIHPTQKPVKLYEWLLDNYTNQGDKILDTHLGSGSIAIACHNRKYDLTACELDKDYYDAAMERLRVHKSQLTMF